MENHTTWLSEALHVQGLASREDVADRQQLS